MFHVHSNTTLPPPPPLSPPQVDWLRLKGFSVVMCNDNRWLEQADTLCDLSICRGWRLMNHKVFGIIPDFATMHTEHRGGGWWCRGCQLKNKNVDSHTRCSKHPSDSANVAYCVVFVSSRVVWCCGARHWIPSEWVKLLPRQGVELERNKRCVLGGGGGGGGGGGLERVCSSNGRPEKQRSGRNGDLLNS